MTHGAATTLQRALPRQREDVARRLRIRSIISHATVAIGVTEIVWLGRALFVPVDFSATGGAWIITTVSVALLAVLCGIIVGWCRAPRTPQALAVALEQRVPDARNLLRTATELEQHPGQTPPDVVTLVAQRADACAAQIDVAACWPLAQHGFRLGLTVMAVGIAAVLVRQLPPAAATGTLRRVAATATDAVAITRLTVQVTPPAYTAQRASTMIDPPRIDVLQGSTVAVTIAAVADSLRLTTASGAHTVPVDARGRAELAFAAEADGYLAVEPFRVDGRRGTRQLLGLSVHTDQLPQVRITLPVRDQMLSDVPATLTVRMEARDDLGLTSLRLRTTKVSGSGERFTFRDDERPVTITRQSGRAWSGISIGPLAAQLTEPGDVLVLRAIASDARPSGGTVESDAVLIERTAEGGIAATGLTMDPDEERSAVSQQMVILKTEQLIARRPRLADSIVVNEAAQIAAEQRRVRAEFVFMMGGEFAQDVPLGEDATTLDESKEAEGESDLAAGRMVNRGRQALLGAVRDMSRAAVALTVADLTSALAREKRALTQLQEAFARSRFLMRALSEREQLDPARRLTGTLDSIARPVLPMLQADPATQRRALQAVLRDLLAQASRPEADPAVYAILAERVLQVDASAAQLQQCAAQLIRLAQRVSTTAIRDRLRDSVATALTQRIALLMRPAAPADRPPVWRTFQAQRQATRSAASRTAQPAPGAPR